MRYHFADCMLDARRGVLSRAGQPRLLPRKVFDVLHYLVAHHDRVVPSEEVCEQVWGGAKVSKATLESCLRLARNGVGDSGQAQRIIQTQRGYGYQCVARVPREAVATCPACDQDTPEQAVFCVACGTRLQQPCAHCQHLQPLSARFCPQCGQPCALAVPSPGGLPGAWQTAHHHVTVLCCTLTPSRQATRAVSDDLYQMLHEFSTLAHSVVSSYGGRLQAAMDMRLVIVFGLHVSATEEAPRAALAALALRRHVKQQSSAWHAQGHGPGAVRMGLHTGRGMVQSWQESRHVACTILGEVVSLATLLQEQAPLIASCAATRRPAWCTRRCDSTPRGQVLLQGNAA